MKTAPAPHVRAAPPAPAKDPAGRSAAPRALGALTRLDGLPVGEGQGRNEEFALGDWQPVVQNFHRPDPGPQGQVQRGLVVGELGSGFDQDVVGGGDDVDGVHPDDGDGHVGALGPLLHADRLVHGPQQTPEVAEETLLRIPLGADLKPESETRGHRARPGSREGLVSCRLGFAHPFTSEETEAPIRLLAQSRTGG